MNPHPWYRREAVAAVLGTLLLALVFCSPMFVHPDGMRQGDGYRDEDWLHDLSFYFYLKKALTEYGQFPLYTHLVGGGYPILGHPSDGSLSPAAIPFLLFKPEVAVRLVMILLLWVGTLGSYWLARERLNLPPPFAFLSAGAFAFSGWFPSFMLTGFYVQIFYLLTPMILHVIQRRRSPARDGVIAGLLLYPVLCQSGNGLPAIGHFLTVTTWLFAAQDLRREGDVPQRVWGHALGLFLFISFVVSYSALFTPVGSILGVAGALWLASKYPTSRRMVLAWRPYLVRLVVAVVILSALGTGKTFSILDTMTGGHYRHGDKDLTTGYRYGRVPSKFGLAKRIVLAFDEVGRLRRGDPPLPELAHLATDTTTPFLDIILGVKKGDGKSFYHPLTFLKYFHRHLPLQTTYRNGWPDNAEYAGLGLTYGVMAVFLLATILALRRSAPWLIVFAFELLICMGPNLPGDPYRTFVWGIPGFEAFNNPFKYFNFFIVVAVTQVFGAGIFALTRFVPAKAALVVGGGLLLWPLAHNAPIFAQLLSKPVKTFEKTADFYQIHQIPDDEMLGMPRRAIQRLGMSLLNRERFRYDCMREYFNVPAGIGTIDWYADIHREENAIPRYYVVPSREHIENPRYLGEVWCVAGSCDVEDWNFTMTRLTATVKTTGPATVMFNQNWTQKWSVEGGRRVSINGRLAVEVDSAGTHRIVVRYRHWPLFAAVAWSFVAFVLSLAFLAIPPRHLPERWREPARA